MSSEFVRNMLTGTSLSGSDVQQFQKWARRQPFNPSGPGPEPLPSYLSESPFRPTRRTYGGKSGVPLIPYVGGPLPATMSPGLMRLLRLGRRAGRANSYLNLLMMLLDFVPMYQVEDDWPGGYDFDDAGYIHCWGDWNNCSQTTDRYRGDVAAECLPSETFQCLGGQTYNGSLINPSTGNMWDHLYLGWIGPGINLVTIGGPDFGDLRMRLHGEWFWPGPGEAPTSVPPGLPYKPPQEGSDARYKKTPVNWPRDLIPPIGIPVQLPDPPPLFGGDYRPPLDWEYPDDVTNPEWGDWELPEIDPDIVPDSPVLPDMPVLPDVSYPPLPYERPVIQVPDPRPRPPWWPPIPPKHTELPPPPKHKEAKIKLVGPVFKTIQEMFHTLTELQDFIDSLTDALPRHLQYHGTLDQEIVNLYRNFGAINWGQAAVNLALNHFEDKLVGGLINDAKTAFRNARRGVGWGGPVTLGGPKIASF